MNKGKLPTINHDRAVRALQGLKKAFEAEDEDIHACVEWALREAGLIPTLEEPIEEKHYFYDDKHDIGYYYDSTKMEIILGEKTWRKKDVETVTLPIESLSNFTCGISGEELVELAKKHLEESAQDADREQDEIDEYGPEVGKDI